MDKDSARALMRVQIAMWLDDYPHESPRSSCATCHRPYKSVDDFLERNPYSGLGFGKQDRDDWFIDSGECWDRYAEEHAAALASVREGTE